MSAIRSEVRKAMSLRSTVGVAVVAMAVTTFGSFATVSNTSGAELTGPLHQQAFFTVGAVNLAAFSLVIGARSFTDEFHHGTIVWTFLFAPSRTRILLAKAAVAGATAALVSLASFGAGSAAALALDAAKDGDLALTGADAGHAVRLALAAAAWAAIGCNVGALVRHATATTVGAVAWMLLVENIVVVPLGPAGDVLPGHAGLAVAGAIESSIPAAGGGLALAAWAGVLGAVALVGLSRRPVATRS